MSSVTKRTVTRTRHEYVVSSPSAFVEVQKAISWALQDIPEQRRHYDDSCTVEARGDEIVVWWEVDQ